MSGDLSVYIHVPFCTRKCDYCHFFVLPHKENFVQTYLAALKKEIALRREILEEHTLISLYFGGGTPSLLPAEAFHEILSWLPKIESEVTLEANPENITLTQMRAYKETGINRISIGIQSLDETQLKLLTRGASAEKAIDSIHMTKEAGFENISIDLMYDIPFQTLSSWRETLSRAVTLPIQHISLYNLTIEPHTPFYKQRERLERSRPNSDDSSTMLQEAIEIFEQHSFMQYEISAFAKENFQAVHNSRYWKARPFLGFGPSAFSYFEGKRFSNHANLQRYCKALENGELPIGFSEKLESQASDREHLVIRLRLLEGVHLDQFPLSDETLASIDKLTHDGLVKKVGSHLVLTSQGRLFYDHLAAELI